MALLLRSSWPALALVLAVATVPARGEDQPAAAVKPAFACPDDMVPIPGGSFLFQGKKLAVKDFCLDSTKVTAEMYMECVDHDKCTDEGMYDGSWRTYALHDDHPINYVNWKQAVAYCEARGHRLPTEVEWEWAARGGPAANPYPWGSEPPKDQLCWSGPGNDAPGGKRTGTCPVLEYPKGATPQGILDMVGNVYEWTASAAPHGKRIIRGACWGTRRPEHISSRHREPADPSKGDFLNGFRCAGKPSPQLGR